MIISTSAVMVSAVLRVVKSEILDSTYTSVGVVTIHWM